jgi:DNA repair protein RadA/Sms
VGGISITSTVEVEALEETPLPFPLVIVDSLNTLRASTAPPSEHAQLVASTRVMVRRARAEDVAMLLVAQVTKDGSLSGPKAVEHLVDVVLWLTRPDASRPEREERELWCSKNRYGSTADVAVFLMTAKGLTPKFDASRFGQGGSGA